MVAPLNFSKAEEKEKKLSAISDKVLARETKLSTRSSTLAPSSRFSAIRSREEPFRASSRVSPTRKGTEEMPEKEEQDRLQNKWDLTSRDIDTIMDVLLHKTQQSLWIPDALTGSTSGNLGDEAFSYLIRNYTEENDEQKSMEQISFDELPTENLEIMKENNSLNKFLEDAIEDWNFDMQKFENISEGKHMLKFGSLLFKRFKLFAILDVDQATVANFLQGVSAGYFRNTYHNSIHGADVANSVAFLLQNGFADTFSNLESVCLLVSALVHDLGHPGVNNLFLITTKSVDALVYNDQSVLENFHVSQFFRLLQNPQANILKNLDEKDWKIFRKLSISAILDTDMQKHFPIMNKFKNMVALGQVKVSEEADRHLIASIIIKAADIGHSAKELSLHKCWSRRLLEEFYQQGDKEMSQGLPVSLLCDRKASISKSQQGFLKFVALPLFEAIDEYCNDGVFSNMVASNVKKNITYWTQEAENEEKGEPTTFLKDTEKLYEDILVYQSTKI